MMWNPGLPDGVNTSQMMVDLQKQAERFGTEAHYKLVTAVDFRPTFYPYHRRQGGTDGRVRDHCHRGFRKIPGLPSEKNICQQRRVGFVRCVTVIFTAGKKLPWWAQRIPRPKNPPTWQTLPKVHLLVRRDEMRASRSCSNGY